MYATVVDEVGEGLGETLGSLHRYVKRFQSYELEQIQAALASTKEDKSNPYNANYPEGATLFAWEVIVRKELQRRRARWRRDE
jgi:hypothetical protein